jgi:hypothetical protein
MLLELIGSTRVSAVVSDLARQIKNGLLTAVTTETLQLSEPWCNTNRLCQMTMMMMTMIQLLLMCYSGIFKPAIETARRRRGKEVQTHRKSKNVITDKGHSSEVKRLHVSSQKY